MVSLPKKTQKTKTTQKGSLCLGGMNDSPIPYLQHGVEVDILLVVQVSEGGETPG